MDTYDQMLSLNINALVKLTYLCIPDMLAHGKGGVINVASTAAFQPVPYIAVYSASKAFVLSFTEALSGEYRERGIRSLALCPGVTDTNFNTIANTNTAGMSSATPEQVAEAGLNAFVKGKSYHVHGRTNYLTSQSAFAGLMGVSVRTLQDWEQGRREPQGPAVALLRIAEQHPEVFSQLH